MGGGGWTIVLLFCDTAACRSRRDAIAGEFVFMLLVLPTIAVLHTFTSRRATNFHCREQEKL